MFFLGDQFQSQLLHDLREFCCGFSTENVTIFKNVRIPSLRYFLACITTRCQLDEVGSPPNCQNFRSHCCDKLAQ